MARQLVWVLASRAPNFPIEEMVEVAEAARVVVDFLERSALLWDQDQLAGEATRFLSQQGG